MGFKNGRATYNELRKQYEKVVITHSLSKDGTARTTCLLVREGNVYVGVSRFSNRTFNFSKKKGRAIAQGRAEFAVNHFAGKVDTRETHKTRREELNYVIVSTDDNTTEDIISNFIHNDEA